MAEINDILDTRLSTKVSEVIDRCDTVITDIHSMRGQPNGLATLGADGKLVETAAQADTASHADNAAHADVAAQADNAAQADRALIAEALSSTLGVAAGGTGCTNLGEVMLSLLQSDNVPQYGDFNIIPGGYCGPFRIPSPGNEFNTQCVGFQYSFSETVRLMCVFPVGERTVYYRWHDGNARSAWRKVFTEEEIVPVTNGGTGAADALSAARQLRFIHYGGWRPEWANDANKVSESCVLRCQNTANVPQGANFGQIITFYDGSSDTKGQIYMSHLGPVHFRGGAGEAWTNWSMCGTAPSPQGGTWAAIRANSPWALPAGGTYAYYAAEVSNEGRVFGGVAPGGSNIAGDTGLLIRGFYWKIA